MVSYPPPLPDDTQPTSPLSTLSEDTQPTTPLRPVSERWRWALPLFIIAVSMTLIGSVIVAVWLRVAAPSTPVNSVTVLVAGNTYEMVSGATTVGEALAELNLSVEEGDELFPPADTPLTPDLTIYINRAREVTLTVDGTTGLIRTALDNPLDIIQNAGVALDADDRVQIDGTITDASSLILWPVPPTTIIIKHALPVVIVADSEEQRVNTTAATVGEALFEAGITLYLADLVTPEVNTPVEADMRVTVIRSDPITVVADGTTTSTRTQGSTVAEALADSGITLAGLDFSVPDEETVVTPGLTIRVVRVTEQVITEQSPIPFQTAYQPDLALELDQRLIVQEGQQGIEQINTRIRYEDGVEVSRAAELTTVVRSPVNRVVNYGTNIVLRTVDTPDGPRQYWRTMKVYATSYYPAALGGDTTTSIGRTLTKGIVGINPDLIPYLTEMYVPGYGLGLAADTGGTRSSPYWIDLGYDDENWVSWSRYVDIYLLAPVPEEVNYLLPEWQPIRGRTP